MSLTASMWTGVSGLLGHGEKMNVVGNNIANVSTVGFKAQRMDFEDFIYATTHSASGPAQIGRGVDIGIIMGDFSQGSFETTTSAVDLAIGGAGFFKVQPIGTEQAFYTRAGNFHFDTDGYLTDPHGYALQGWKIDNTSGPVRAAGGAGPSEGSESPIKGAGVPRDVRLDTWTVPPKQTTKTSVITNLAADGGDSSRNAPNPFAALIQSWDGTQPPPNNRPTISEDSFAYTTSIKVYDESGLQHTLTVYYDRVDPATYNGKSGESMWEYMVTMDPAEDKRQVWDLTANGGTGGLVDLKTTKMGGMLMSGVMTFSPKGDVIDQTAYTLQGNIPYTKDTSGNPVEDGTYYHWDKNPPPPGEKQALVPIVNGVDTWQGITSSLYPASVSQSGYPMLVANFGGVGGAQTSASPKGENYLMEFNLGLRVTDFAHPWTSPDTQSLATTTVMAADLTQNTRYTLDNQNGPKIVQKNLTYSESAMTNFQTAYNKDVANGVFPAGPPYPATYIGTGGDVEAWLNSVIPGTYANETAALAATWPYNPVTAGQGYLGTQAQNQTFADYTPNTTTLGFVNGTAQVDPNHTTMLGSTYATANGTGQNGYTFGNLTGYDVDADGVLYGVYSNGVTLGLYQLTLYDFTCHQGLRREGGNLFSQTMESGEPFFGPPQTYGFGKIASYTLEQSNVDMAREFVQMITTQRGFQANSKVVTTTDTMLETVVTMKR